MMMREKKEKVTRLVVPLLIEIINESVLVVVSTRAAAALGSERDTAVASAGGEEARAGGCEDYEHVLLRMLADVLAKLGAEGKLTTMKRAIPAHIW